MAKFDLDIDPFPFETIIPVEPGAKVSIRIPKVMQPGAKFQLRTPHTLKGNIIHVEVPTYGATEKSTSVGFALEVKDPKALQGLNPMKVEVFKGTEKILALLPKLGINQYLVTFNYGEPATDLVWCDECECLVRRGSCGHI